MAAEQHVENEENPEKNLKHKREPSVLDNFTKLTNGQEKVRVKAGVNLLRHLWENENGEKVDNELNYALGRLIRGLGSSKVQAKTGFFAALVGLFNLKSITIHEILEYVSKELHKGGSNSKSENADVSSGQILIVGAILRSNLYESCSDEDKTKVLQLLLTAGKERNYLNLASFTFLVDLFKKIDSKEFEKVVFPLVKDELSIPWSLQNLDILYLLSEIERSFPESLHSKFLRNNLGTSEVLCRESLQHVCNTLTTIPRLLALKHPVFDIFTKKLLESSLIEEFFIELDQTLVRPNRNKFFVFTKLLTDILGNLNDPTIIPNILTKNYIQQTLSMYKNSVGRFKDKEFKDITQKLFETLLTSLKKDGVKSKTKIKVLKKLLFFPGIFIFEKITRSRLIQNITASLSSEGVKKLGMVYRDVILANHDKVINENISEKWWNTDRVYAAHLLVKLVNHPSTNEENEWKIEQLMFLGKLGLLKDQAIGLELAESLKYTFYSALDLKLGKLDDLRFILSTILHEFDNLIPDLRNPLDEENQETWRRTVELVTKLDGHTKKKKAVFHTLFLNLGLQIFNDTKLATDSLTELFTCYERTKKKNEESDDPLWIEVVVDLFLNLLSHNSHLLRSVINCVFPHLCKYMNGSAIHQILSVLDPKNEDNPLSKPQQESDEDSTDVEEEEEEDDSSSDEDINDEEEDHTVNDKLRIALHQVLGADAQSDAESVDLNDLDDEEGDKLNEALGQAFKQFKPNLGRNKKQKKDDEALTHFRIRVLDLVEIYLNTNPSMLLTLEIMLPLLQLLEFCIKDDHQKPLEDRVKACLKKLSALKKFSYWEDVTEDVLVELLKSLLQKGTKNAIVIQEMSEKIADCSMFVITCSQIVNAERTKKINCVIKEGLEAFFTRRDCIIPYVLFKNLLQMNWEGILVLVPFLLGCVFASSIRPFRKNQAVELMKIFLHNQRFISSHAEEIVTVEDDFLNFLRDSVDFFREFNANSSQKKTKEKFLANLFDLLYIVKISVLGRTFEGWELLGEGVRNCRSLITFSRDTKLAFNKLCKSLNISNVVEMRKVVVNLNNAEGDDGEEQQVSKKQEKRKKKTKNKDKLKLKKQSKELRLQGLSEGFSCKRKFTVEETDIEEDESKKVKFS
ncbi:myb-binding protein 1A-like [Zophobas morio]|uniref:myb-binding protein 1A-like n=1 Tax=Zophobas morio TaxID=2755281 RepID=UPI003082E273